jgi:DNA-binding transcriptional ArsR family regulator
LPTYSRLVSADRDITAVAQLMGQPARASMCLALMSGRALTTTELAHVAGIGVPTASDHLRLLVKGGLVTVVAQGRHKYHRLANAEVAALIEGLARLSPPLPVRTLRQSRSAAALAAARTCYDHIAGRLGVGLYEGLIISGALTLGRGGLSVDPGHDVYAELGIDVPELERQQRVLVRECLDWTERRPHLAGLLAARLLTSFREAGWVTSTPRPRGLDLTQVGRGRLERLGVLAPDALAARDSA